MDVPGRPTYHVALELVLEPDTPDPDNWNWRSLLDLGPHEAVKMLSWSLVGETAR